MSWSVSASGLRATVKQKIDEQIRPHTASDDQKVEFTLARVACHAAVDSLSPSDTHCSLSASGSYHSVSMSISGWKEEPKPSSTETQQSV